MKKNKKRMIVLTITIIIIISIFFWVFSFVTDYNNSKTILKEDVKMMKQSYKTFENNIEYFSSVREEVYTIILKEIYYEELESKNKQFEKILSKYNKISIRIKNDSEKLEELCFHKTYYDVSVNNICKKFMDTYEIAINTYVNDINIYNDYIKKYNQWILENNIELKSISYYQSKEITKLIDYNKDGEYLELEK